MLPTPYPGTRFVSERKVSEIQDGSPGRMAWFRQYEVTEAPGAQEIIAATRWRDGRPPTMLNKAPWRVGRRARDGLRCCYGVCHIQERRHHIGCIVYHGICCTLPVGPARLHCFRASHGWSSSRIQMRDCWRCSTNCRWRTLSSRSFRCRSGRKRSTPGETELAATMAVCLSSGLS